MCVSSARAEPFRQRHAQQQAALPLLVNPPMASPEPSEASPEPSAALYERGAPVKGYLAHEKQPPPRNLQ